MMKDVDYTKPLKIYLDTRIDNTIIGKSDADDGSLSDIEMAIDKGDFHLFIFNALNDSLIYLPTRPLMRSPLSGYSAVDVTDKWFSVILKVIFTNTNIGIFIKMYNTTTVFDSSNGAFINPSTQVLTIALAPPPIAHPLSFSGTI